MARKYNKTIYKIFSTGTKVFRSHCSANPMEKIEEKGAEGKMIASIGNKILEKPVQKLSYGLTSLSYNKETDNPCKGSVVYTVYYMLIKRALKLFLGVLVMIFSTAFVMRFLNADLLMKIRLSIGLVVFILIILAIGRLAEIFTGKKRNKRK